MQAKYGFKARTYQAAGFANVAEYKKVHGSDLFIRDIEEYDKICKVSLPLQSLTVACLHLAHIIVSSVLMHICCWRDSYALLSPVFGHMNGVAMTTSSNVCVCR